MASRVCCVTIVSLNLLVQMLAAILCERKLRSLNIRITKEVTEGRAVPALTRGNGISCPVRKWLWL